MNYVNMEERELDSAKQVRKLLKNLENPEMQTRDAVLHN